MQGITGDCRSLTQGIYLEINEGKTCLFYITDELPRGIDVILGSKWLIENGYVMTRNPALPPLSEGIVKMPTKGEGVRLIERQELLPGVYCGTCLVECNGEFVSCLAVNLTTEPIMTLPLPKLIKHPCKFEGPDKEQPFSHQRINELNKKLRLSHIKEGEESIRELCEEYADIFKLEGDKLTATAATMHHIPTPHFPKGRAITLKNYRLAEAHKEEVDKQVNQMLEDGIIVPSKSE
jgi:hypothetical protein